MGAWRNHPRGTLSGVGVGVDERPKSTSYMYNPMSERNIVRYSVNKLQCIYWQDHYTMMTSIQLPTPNVGGRGR